MFKMPVNTETAAPSAEEIVVKHQLENKWTLWYYAHKSAIWKDNINEIASFDTVEDFWNLFNHIKSPSHLSFHSDYNYFKNGIMPMWEDDKNSAGGRWILKLPPVNKSPHVDDYWKNLIMSVIGEVYEHSCEINGAAINVRSKSTTISIWTNNASNENKDNIITIGKKIKEVLGAENKKLVYVTHADNAKKLGTFAKQTFIL